MSKSRRVVFVCGGALNEGEFYGRFRKVFNLVVDPDTLRARLIARGEKSPTNNPIWLEWSVAMTESQMGPTGAAIPIRGDHRSVEASADAILVHVDECIGEALVRSVVRVVRPVYRSLRRRLRK